MLRLLQCNSCWLPGSLPLMRAFPEVSCRFQFRRISQGCRLLEPRCRFACRTFRHPCTSDDTPAGTDKGEKQIGPVPMEPIEAGSAVFRGSLWPGCISSNRAARFHYREISRYHSGEQAGLASSVYPWNAQHYSLRIPTLHRLQKVRQSVQKEEAIYVCNCTSIRGCDQSW